MKHINTYMVISSDSNDPHYECPIQMITIIQQQSTVTCFLGDTQQFEVISILYVLLMKTVRSKSHGFTNDVKYIYPSNFFEHICRKIFILVQPKF